MDDGAGADWQLVEGAESLVHGEMSSRMSVERESTVLTAIVILRLSLSFTILSLSWTNSVGQDRRGPTPLRQETTRGVRLWDNVSFCGLFSLYAL
jgi:hypothetical protein|tara:strand:+ start:2040 stop:2324 length:285 start_codon:yes stop_codon:yes gene_type:complete